jgi:hypothetical protein
MHILPCSWSGCIVMMMKSPTLLRPSFRAACFQTRAISSKKDPVAPPRALLDALSEGWFRVIQVCTLIHVQIHQPCWNIGSSEAPSLPLRLCNTSTAGAWPRKRAFCSSAYPTGH